ncbi:MAG TPA: TIGR00282 family metallophosphoesterase [Thermoanaerobaculia bacterium]
MNILFVGDVVGSPGRRALVEALGSIIDKRAIDFTIVNIENAAGGFGLTVELFEELSKMPIDVFSSGNHIWDKKEIYDSLNSSDRLLRPANYPPGNPGRGATVQQTAAGIPVGVVNLQGQVFMPANADSPFRVADEELAKLEAKVVVVDMHAEATSEKMAMGWYLDGRVSAVLGTHTHVPTADEIVLPGGTAYQSDVGMTGAYEGIIGFSKDRIIEKFLSQTPRSFETAKRDIRLSGAIVAVDVTTGKAKGIERVRVRVD